MVSRVISGWGLISSTGSAPYLILNFPTDILTIVMHYFSSLKEVINFTSSCKNLYNRDFPWQKMCIQSAKPDGISWRTYYISLRRLGYQLQNVTPVVREWESYQEVLCYSRIMQMGHLACIVEEKKTYVLNLKDETSTISKPASEIERPNIYGDKVSVFSFSSPYLAIRTRDGIIVKEMGWNDNVILNHAVSNDVFFVMSGKSLILILDNSKEFSITIIVDIKNPDKKLTWSEPKSSDDEVYDYANHLVLNDLIVVQCRNGVKLFKFTNSEIESPKIVNLVELYKDGRYSEILPSPRMFKIFGEKNLLAVQDFYSNIYLFDHSELKLKGVLKSNEVLIGIKGHCLITLPENGQFVFRDMTTFGVLKIFRNSARFCSNNFAIINNKIFSFSRYQNTNTNTYYYKLQVEDFNPKPQVGTATKPSL